MVGASDEGGDEVDAPRSVGARLGIVALNLACPGLGLFRVGDWRRGLLWLVAPFALMVLFTFGLGQFPIASYGAAVLALAVVLVLLVAVYVVPIALTWCESASRMPLRWWSRWYALTAIAIVMLGLAQLAPPAMHHFYKPFYAPSASMAPTIGQGDRFVVDMRWRGPLVPGAVIAFHTDAADRVDRIAGLPGDRIAMRGGVPVINGVAVPQEPRGHLVFADYSGPRQASALVERFPGEPTAHTVLDAGPSPFDDTPEVVVPPGHVFVLGDNRNRAADSRVSPAMFGVGMVPVSAIVGRATYIHWSEDRAAIGKRLDR